MIRAARPPEMTQERADALVDIFDQAFPERTQGDIRFALRAAADPVDQARAVAARVAELGLERSPQPEALPAIGEDDIHLVCWLAIVGES